MNDSAETAAAEPVETDITMPDGFCIEMIAEWLHLPQLIAFGPLPGIRNQISQVAARHRLLDAAVLDRIAVHEIVNYFLDSTSEQTEMYLLRDDLTAQEAMDLYWRIHHSTLLVDERCYYDSS